MGHWTCGTVYHIFLVTHVLSMMTILTMYLALYFSGDKVLPWLGEIQNLAPISDFPEPPYGEDDNKTPFPVRPTDRRSYSQNCVVWIKPSGLQVRANV